MGALTSAPRAFRFLPCAGPWSEAGICALLLLLALVVRSWGLPAQNWAMYGDEAQLMIEARRFSLDQYPTPFTTDMLSLPALALCIGLGLDTVAAAAGGLLGWREHTSPTPPPCSPPEGAVWARRR